MGRKVVFPAVQVPDCCYRELQDRSDRDQYQAGTDSHQQFSFMGFVDTSNLPGPQALGASPLGTGPGCVALRPVERLDLFEVFQAHKDPSTQSGKEPQMIILGIVLVVVGLVASIPILETIGVILLVIGAILWILGSMGRAVGGRKHYY